jgi:hypothetical protein
VVEVRLHGLGVVAFHEVVQLGLLDVVLQDHLAAGEWRVKLIIDQKYDIWCLHGVLSVVFDVVVMQSEGFVANQKG